MVTLNGKRIETESFPNGETLVKDFEEAILTDDDNILEFKYRDDADLIALMFVKKRIDEIAASCKLFVWYMPYSRMDRKIEGRLFTLKYITDAINALKFSKVVVMEPHSDRTLEMLNRAVACYPVKDWLPYIKGEIGFMEGRDHLVLPDKGALARYSEEASLNNTLVMEKKRNPITGKIEGMHLKSGKVNPNSKCIIIDDLCSKGGTFAWAASILKSMGAFDIYLIVSHCEDTIFKGKLLKDDSPITHIYTSDSMMGLVDSKITYMTVDVSKYVNSI